MNKTGNKLEKRSYTFEIRSSTDENGEAILTGRPIVYDSETDLFVFREVIEKGALDDADLTDVRFLVNHNTDMIPLARSRRNNGNSTMKFSVDKKGLNLDFVKLDIKNNATARELYSAVNRGDLTGMSFMFSIDEETWEDLETDKPLRHINKIGSVVEVSAVTFPAYSASEINARNLKALESAKATLDNVRSAKREVDTSKKELDLLKERLKLI